MARPVIDVVAADKKDATDASLQRPRPYPLSSTPDALYVGSSGGYFDIGRSETASHTPKRRELSLHISRGPSPTETALIALQYLPVPVLVLSDTKQVVLANEAMGRLLSIDASASSPSQRSRTITDLLRDQTLSQLGIDMLQNRLPVWVKWETFLDSLVQDAVTTADGVRKTSKTPETSTAAAKARRLYFRPSYPRRLRQHRRRYLPTPSLLIKYRIRPPSTTLLLKSSLPRCRSPTSKLPQRKQTAPRQLPPKRMPQ